MFPIWLALLDFVPCILFGIAIIKLGFTFGEFLFLTGALIITIAGFMKATWKLIFAYKKKDIKWMNKSFFKTMMVGFLLALISIIKARHKIVFSTIFQPVRLIFLIITIVLFLFMSIYRKTKFKQKDFKTNFVGEILNSIAMLSLLIAVFIK